MSSKQSHQSQQSTEDVQNVNAFREPPQRACLSGELVSFNEMVGSLVASDPWHSLAVLLVAAKSSVERF